jgi:hypothetical protein
VGTARPHVPEKLVIALLVAEPGLVEPVRSAVEAGIGEVDYVSPPLEFDFTHYYEAEMGAGLKRLFLSIAELVDPSRLAELKATTDAMEARFAVGGRRRVNLDPGMLSQSRFILASTKDSSHRVPLDHGYFAEVTLVYEHGQFRPVEWTYPDFASTPYRMILQEIRTRYVASLRAAAKGPKA